jgi:RNAse (barnase) inhibitor barstar
MTEATAMHPEILTRPGRPWLHRLVASTSDLCDAVAAIEAAAPGRVAARIVRGRKATTKAAFLDEAAAALQFPYYFGNNWDAFYDCVTDLSWLHAESGVVCVADAGHLLENAPGRDVDSLVEVMCEALRTVNDQGRALGPKALHVVLHTTPEELPLFEQRWSELDVDDCE